MTTYLEKKESEGQKTEAGICDKKQSFNPVSNLILLILTMNLVLVSDTEAAEKWLASPDEYSYVSTETGLYIHWPTSVTFIPGYSLMRDALVISGNILFTSFIDNIDAYMIVLAAFQKGIAPLGMRQAVSNIQYADRLITYYTIISMSLLASSYLFNEPIKKNLLKPHAELIHTQFNAATDNYQTSFVYTGNATFDHQLRVSLITPSETTDPEALGAAGNDDSEKISQPHYSRSILHLAPTPFHFHTPPELDGTPLSRILEAINFLDRGAGDEVFLGKDPDGEFFIAVFSQRQKKYHYIWLDTTDLIHYHNGRCAENNPQVAFEPLLFLFSEPGSRLFQAAMQCLYTQYCSQGQMTSFLGNNSTSLLIPPEETDFFPEVVQWVYEGPDPALQTIPAVSHKRLSYQKFNCNADGAECHSGLFWAHQKGGLPEYIRIASGSQIHNLYQAAGTENPPGQFIAREYPFSFHDPSVVRSFVLPFWVLHSLNPFRPVLRKAHRSLLGKAVNLCFKRKISSQPANIIAATYSRGIQHEVARETTMSLQHSDPQKQALANIHAQLYFGEAYKGGNWFTFLYDWLMDSIYVRKAKQALFRGREDTGLYLWLPDQQRGMYWLAYGASKYDKSSIRMLLKFNELGHFVSLSPAVTAALKQFLHNKPVPMSKARARTKNVKLTDYWKQKLDEAYKATHDTDFHPVQHKSRETLAEPEIWEDADFINAMHRVRTDLNWQTPSPSELKNKQDAIKKHRQSAPATSSSFMSRHVPGSKSTTAVAEPKRQASVSIHEKDLVRKKLHALGLNQQWVNKALTEIEDASWGEIDGKCLIKGKQVRWQGTAYNLYHNSRGEKIVNREGHSATVFFIRQGNQAVIIAAGEHPKPTRTEPKPWNKYKIRWTDNLLKDPEIVQGKTFKLPATKQP